MMWLFIACTSETTSTPDAIVPAFGLPLVKDGTLYAGIARVDITPTISETYQDLDGDAYFDGCVTDPSGTRGGCDEPFNDINGNGQFDAVWGGGGAPVGAQPVGSMIRSTRLHWCWHSMANMSRLFLLMQWDF